MLQQAQRLPDQVHQKRTERRHPLDVIGTQETGENPVVYIGEK